MKNLFTLFFMTMALSIFAQVQVTFQVDMTGQSVSPDGVHIAGSMNGWNTTANMLTDQGDNIYAVTLNLTPGSDYEYKYLNGNAWGTEEAAPGTCTVGGNNRIFTTPTSDVTLPATPFNDCPTPVETQMVTFKVDMTGQTISNNGIHVTGNFQGWNPGSTALTDIGNNIYEVTVPVLSDITVVQYKFLNGNDWGTEETPGAGCGNGDNNRIYVIKDAGNVELPVATFGGCTNPVPTRTVVFRVDLDGTSASADGVHVAGSFQGWNPEGTPMTDIGDNTYEVEVEVMEPIQYLEYKYLNGNAWGTEESVPEECSYNSNRFAIIELNSPDVVTLKSYIIGTCNESPVSTINLASSPLFKVAPTIANETISIIWESSINEQASLLVNSIDGKVVLQETLENIKSLDSKLINVCDWKPGVYIVQLRTAKSLFSQKIIVQ